MGIRAELLWGGGGHSHLEVTAEALGRRHTQCHSRKHAWCLWGNSSKVGPGLHNPTGHERCY